MQQVRKGREVRRGREFDLQILAVGIGRVQILHAEVFRQGYTLRGRVIRPAGVRVERGE